MGADKEPHPLGDAEESQSIGLLEFYQRETHYWDQQMRRHFGEVGVILTRGLTAAVALTVALIQFEAVELLFVVLLMLPILWLAATRVLADGMAAAAYRRHADFETERCLLRHDPNTSLRTWAGRAGHVLRHSPSVWILQPAMVSLSGLLWLFCAVVMWVPDVLTDPPAWLQEAAVIAAAPLLICAGVAASAVTKVRKRVLEAVDAVDRQG